ncbi:EF-P 5-aminopentanol modification-associated protein YfmH [Amphibacillus cookii]|uniref:EF-P 5-aminopentanol modification-associated protein YfmH n=1 Tax=Amphibacillus cookii TaxID=767787 RepID=UPI001955F914|nr:pitrilysin family protein [Amphibacillus cookii]MBM7540634.1 putative Zn-dependent peptidase [Amphibacillus cookii]
MHKKHYPQIKETVYRETLPNGLRVILVPKNEMAQTYGVFTTDYGSIDQSFVPINSDERITVPDGIAHFLEHKLFEKEDRDVFQDFTKNGASANAFTSFTKTAYLFSATSEVEKNTEILLDFVQTPYFSDQSVEKEKGIIAQEIQMYDDQPDWRAFFGIIATMYNAHPVKIDIAGTVDSIQLITKEDLYTCYHTFYHPSNMTVTLVGQFDPEQMIALIKKNQAQKSFEKPPHINRFYPEEELKVAKAEDAIEMPVAVAKCMVGIKEEPKQDSQTFIKEELLADMLLDYFYSKSGEYYQELYDKDLIDGSLGFESERQKQFAFSVIGGNTSDPDKFAETVKLQLDSFKSYQLRKEDFERMKRKMIGGLLRDMNSTSEIANQVSQYQMLDIDFFELLPTLESLSLQDANQFLNNWIKDDNVAVFQVKIAEAS